MGKHEGTVAGDEVSDSSLPGGAAGRGPVGLVAAAEEAKREWGGRREAGLLTERTEALYVRHLDTFLRYAAAAGGVHDVDGVTAKLIAGWVNAPISAVSPGSRARGGQPASSATRRSRQGALRQAVTVWADLGWVAADLIPARIIHKDPPRLPCPVTPAEAARLRMAGQQSPADTLLPALVAMALAGASSTEIARLKVGDYDPDTHVLHLGGRGQRVPRTAELDEHGARVVGAHVRALTKVAAKRKIVLDPEVTPLALPTAPRTHSTHVDPTAVGQHMYRALQCAGINRDGVTPGSMQEHAANRCYSLTNRVEDVAALLGLKSLDAAMAYMDPTWQQTWADTIRGQQV